MPNILIELSNKTTEVMADNLVEAFAQHGVSPCVYRFDYNGDIETKSNNKLISEFRIFSRLFPDRYRHFVRGRVSTKLYRAMTEAKVDEVVDAFILFNDGGGHRRVIAEWGRRNDVPVFYVPESPISVGLVPKSYFSFRANLMMNMERWLFPLVASNLCEGLAAEYVCAPNAEFARSLKGVSRRPQKMDITGSPLYDKTSVQTIPSEPPSHTVMFIHQPMLTRSTRYRGFAEAFFKLAEQEHRLDLLFKVHPRTSQAEMAMIAQMIKACRAEERIQVMTAGDIRTMMQNVAAVVVAMSTATNDAILAGVPVILLKNAFDDGINSSLDTYGAVIPLHCSEQLYSAVTKAVFDAQTRSDLGQAIISRLIPKYFLGLDGKASERIVSFVLS